MTSLRADFEMHAIWQGYVEDPAAKDFIARKARTIASLSKARGTQQSTFNKFGNPLRIPYLSCTV
jgi:hypothetical protein